MDLVCQHECNEKAQKRNSVNAYQATMEQPSRTIVHAKLEMTNPDSQEEAEADAAANDIVQGGKIARSIFAGSAGGGISVSSQMEGRLNSLQGGGQIMPDGLRNMMERGFNRDFSQVRLHTDSEAASLSSSIHAKAFTHGNDIYFNQGQFSPNTSEGQKLMAHELTHVVQGGGKVGRSPNCEEHLLSEEEGVKDKVIEICNKVLSVLNDGMKKYLITSAYKKYVSASPGIWDCDLFCNKVKQLLIDLKMNVNDLPMKVCNDSKYVRSDGEEFPVICETTGANHSIETITCYNPYINSVENLDKAFTIIHEFTHMWVDSKDDCYWSVSENNKLYCGNNNIDRGNVASAIEYFVKNLYNGNTPLTSMKNVPINLGERQEATPVKE